MDTAVDEINEPQHESDEDVRRESEEGPGVETAEPSGQQRSYDASRELSAQEESEAGDGVETLDGEAQGQATHDPYAFDPSGYGDDDKSMYQDYLGAYADEPSNLQEIGDAYTAFRCNQPDDQKDDAKGHAQIAAKVAPTNPLQKKYGIKKNKQRGKVVKKGKKACSDAACTACSPSSQERGNIVPVTVVVGGSQSGKSTLLTYILRANQSMRILLIEEVSCEGAEETAGKRPISGERVAEQDVSDEYVTRIQTQAQVKSLHKTRVRKDLVRIISKSLKGVDLVLIETRDPDVRAICQTFLSVTSMKCVTVLDAVIAVVDTPSVAMNKTESLEMQVPYADQIIMNKTDLCTREEMQAVVEYLRSINSYAGVMRVQLNDEETTNPNKLLPLICGRKGFEIERALDLDPMFLDIDDDDEDDANGSPDAGKQSNISSVALHMVGSVNLEKWQDWYSQLIESHGEELYRYQGVVAVENVQHKFVFHGLHDNFAVDFASFDWQEDEERSSLLWFVGRDLDRRVLDRGFRACLE